MPPIHQPDFSAGGELRYVGTVARVSKPLKVQRFLGSRGGAKASTNEAQTLPLTTKTVRSRVHDRAALEHCGPLSVKERHSARADGANSFCAQACARSRGVGSAKRVTNADDQSAHPQAAGGPA